jgi:hypothetical protein
MLHWNTHCTVLDAAVAVGSLSYVESATLKPRSLLLYFLVSLSTLRTIAQVNAVSKKDTGELMALKRMEKFAVLQSAAHLKSVVTYIGAFRFQPATRPLPWPCFCLHVRSFHLSLS